MSPETKLKVAKLSDLTIGQLAAKYEKLFGEKCRSRNRRYVHRRIAWKLQADDEGGLSEQAILRATVVAGESLIRLTPPKSRKPKKEDSKVLEKWDSRLPLPGHPIARKRKNPCSGRLLSKKIMKIDHMTCHHVDRDPWVSYDLFMRGELK